ncbi:MAG TPA: DsbA family protein [Asticcacaulis sp.]|nr:DsbA family protein [Asticcacaulis sp.]
MSENPAPELAKSSLFTQANITTALAVLAVVLAGAPYMVPQLQSWQVEKGLMARPTVLVDASKALQKQQMAQSAKADRLAINAHRESIFNDKSDPVIGKGPIKVVEFLDYQCAYCRAATPAVRDFLAENPDVQLVVKEYPIVHPDNSAALAALAIAASRAGKYEAVHYGFLGHDFHPEIPNARIAGDVDAITAKAGLDPAALKESMKDPAIQEQINRTINLGISLGINGTPTFIVGDQMVNGADITALQNAVQAQRAASKKAG